MPITSNTLRNLIIAAAIASAVAGCSSGGAGGPPPRTPIPIGDTTDAPQPTVGKPLPELTRDDLAPPPFDDVPLVNQQAPETPAFLDAYARVGRPRVVVFVNRTLEGEIIPVNPNDPLASVEHTRRTTTAMSVDRRDTEVRGNVYREETRERSDRFESKGPAEYRETTSVYLRPGQYDEVSAKSLDYGAIENVLTDFLGADGQVVLISPTLARQKLTAEQVKELESGRPQVLSEIAKQLGSDILVHVTARPTRQTRQGLEVRILCEAMNIKGGQSIGRAFVDVPPPLEKTQINRYTRFLARKLMDGMTRTWSAPPPVGMEAPAAPANVPANANAPLPPPVQAVERPSAGPASAAPVTPTTVPATRE